jgi:hypothetical protein
MKSKKGVWMLALVLVWVVSLVSPATVVSADDSIIGDSIRPIVFIHGTAGSVYQFGSQFQRFASNGYPTSYFFGFEWDAGGLPRDETVAVRTARLDAFVDSILEKTGADQVYMLGHSAGHGVATAYFAEPEHRAKVAKYVSFDAGAGGTAPDGIQTLVAWAEIAGNGDLNPPRTITGATNVVIPNTYHVGTASHAKTFAEIYRFFTNIEPATTDIVPEPPGQVELAGKAALFPKNFGVGDATLEIWEVNGATGARISRRPAATYALSGSGYDGGTWGPFKAHGSKYYELVLLRKGFRPHHFYFQPFMRSDYFIRLNTSPAGGIGDYLDRSDYHSNIVITRELEFRQDSRHKDILEVNHVNVLEALTPIVKAITGLFVYDKNADGVSNLTGPIPYLHTQAFLSGVDFYMPAAYYPNGTISLVLTPHDGGKKQAVNLPNWASSEHAISVRFNDYTQEITSWTDYVPRQAPGQKKK